MKTRVTQVHIDDSPVFDCTVPVPEVRWNGWACPTFDHMNALKVVTMATAGDQDEYYKFVWTTDRDGLLTLVMGHGDGSGTFEYEVVGDEVTGFAIGAFSWVWTEVTDR